MERDYVVLLYECAGDHGGGCGAGGVEEEGEREGVVGERARVRVDTGMVRLDIACVDLSGVQRGEGCGDSAI